MTCGLAVLTKTAAPGTQKPKNIRMVHCLLTGLYLSMKGLLSSLVHVSKNLDADLLPRLRIVSQITNSKLAIAQLFDDLVVFN